MSLKYHLQEVNDKLTIKEFLDLPSALYIEDKNWIRPLDEDIEKVFDKKQNKLFRNGKAIRWILKDETNKTAGRIAAFYDPKTAKKEEQPTGGTGFFECINDQDAANILFNAAQQWLRKYGMEAMDGPVNFGSRDHFWGCLSDGFYEPIYNMPYNPYYYNELFENYGFKEYYKQLTFHMNLIPGTMDPVIAEKAERLKRDKKYSFKHFSAKEVDKAALWFTDIFNAAWAKFPGVSPMRKSQATALFNTLKPVVDPKLIIFAFYQGKPIAFFLMLPDLFQVIKKFNGKFHLLNKLRMLFHLKIKKTPTRAIGLIFGVIPEFQSKGVAEGMIRFFEETVKKGVNYTDLELNWIGDYNTPMVKLCKQIGSTVRKTHITYRYLFDRDKPFNRIRSF
jgi:hypothetical protein